MSQIAIQTFRQEDIVMVRQHGWRQARVVALFVGPSLLGLVLFTLGPLLASLGISLTSWDLLTPPQFVGFANFTELLGSADIRDALLHTLIYIAIYLPVVLVLGLLLAILLNRPLRGLQFYRTAFFMPVVSSWVAVSLMWKWLLNPAFGLVNYLLGLLHLPQPGWWADPHWALPAVIIASIWKDLGFVMVLLLAGLQNIGRQYYEAARVDGAGAWRRFINITIPLLSPSIFFVVVISLINSFQVFDQVWVMTGGGPGGASSVLVEQIVQNAFSYSRMGYASALSWLLFAIIFGITALQFSMQKRWVTYD
jgi:multiple sugar transport system permease protein